MENIVVVGILSGGICIMYILTKVTNINILEEMTRPSGHPEEKEDIV